MLLPFLTEHGEMFGFGKSRYFGLTGTRLNIAIGILAGLDFLLFGYDQGVMGGILDLPSFVRKNRKRNRSLVFNDTLGENIS